MLIPWNSTDILPRLFWVNLKSNDIKVILRYINDAKVSISSDNACSYPIVSAAWHCQKVQITYQSPLKSAVSKTAFPNFPFLLICVR